LLVVVASWLIAVLLPGFPQQRPVSPCRQENFLVNGRKDIHNQQWRMQYRAVRVLTGFSSTLLVQMTLLPIGWLEDFCFAWSYSYSFSNISQSSQIDFISSM
jgi:hypothetical protein